MVDKLPFLADEHHYAIAAVATRAAQLDAHIELSIYAVLSYAGFHSACEFILKNMNGDRYVGLLQDLLRDELPAKTAEIENAFAEIKRLRRERNEILHWLYGTADDASLAKSTSIRPFRQKETKFRTADQMQAIAAGLLNQVVLLTGWIDLVHQKRSPKPSPYAHALLSLQPNLASPSVQGLLGNAEELARLQDRPPEKAADE